ncbi:MAG: hypothetical protein WC753_03165 [Candidatus Gracilibacteria bacterium]
MKSRGEQLSGEESDNDIVSDNAYRIPLPSKPDMKPSRSPYRPTNREYALYVATLVAGILLSQLAQNDNAEAVLGHINSEILNTLGAGVSTVSLLRWALHECGFIERNKSK